MGNLILDDLDLYSDLLSSVGTHDKDRPLLPIECSDMIVRLKEETGESWEQLSKRLGLGKKRKIKTSSAPPDTAQIKLFEKLQNLSRKNAYALGWGRTGDGKIGFTIGCLVASLPDKDAHDIILSAVLASQDTDKPILKTDVINICDRVRGSPEKPVEEIIEYVLKIKPVTEILHKIGISPYTDFLVKFNQILSEKQISSKELLTKLIHKIFKNNEISSIYLSKSNTLWFTLEPEKFQELEKKWKAENKPVTNFFNDILTEAMKNE